MIFGLIKLCILLMFCYCLLRFLKRKYPDSEFIELVEFITGLIEGFMVVCSLALFVLFAIGLLILL